MNLGLGLNLHIGLEQRLAPQMIQSLKLLQMNSLELELVVSQELETNPLLEAVEEYEEIEENKSDTVNEDSDPDTTPTEDPEKIEAQQAKDELPLEELRSPDREESIDWESYLDEGFDTGNRMSEELESPDERYERTPVATKSLQDHLLGQLADRRVSPEVRPVVEYLINTLDDYGYLNSRLPDDMPQELLDRLHSDSESNPLIVEVQEVLFGGKTLEKASPALREAFHALQSLEPAGIGARNLRECLLLQLYRVGDTESLGFKIIHDHFDLLEKLKISNISKELEVTPKDVQDALKEIGRLEPRPGRLLAKAEQSSIIPDLIVEEIDGELVLMLNDRTVPSLRISKAYANLLRKGSQASTDEKKFVREKLNSATWLIRAIEQRKSTMLKVMQAIIEGQPDFFKKDPTQLKPLILQDIADKIGMHISTVSRVTNGKYVQTHHGIYELKYFFTAGVQQSDGSEVSAVAAKEEIRKLIEAEDSSKPLSDQRIVEILKNAGLDVARRTVAKYRDQMEVLPARLRKKY